MIFIFNFATLDVKEEIIKCTFEYITDFDDTFYSMERSTVKNINE